MAATTNKSNSCCCYSPFLTGIDWSCTASFTDFHIRYFATYTPSATSVATTSFTSNCHPPFYHITTVPPHRSPPTMLTISPPKQQKLWQQHSMNPVSALNRQQLYHIKTLEAAPMTPAATLPPLQQQVWQQQSPYWQNQQLRTSSYSWYGSNNSRCNSFSFNTSVIVKTHG